MIVDQCCETIVVIDKDPITWIPEGDEEKVFGEFTLKEKGKSSNIASIDLIDVSLEHQANKFESKVRVFHFTDWDSDSPIPPDSSCLLQLLELVDGRRRSDDSKSTVVMCRDGYSQSGLFCCISNARDQIKSDEEVDIFQISRQLLVRRPQFIMNYDQYQCCYNIIRDYIETTDVYVN